MASIIEGAMKFQTESGGGDGANVDGVLDLFSGIQHTLGGLIVSSVYDSCTAYTTAFMFPDNSETTKSRLRNYDYTVQKITIYDSETTGTSQKLRIINVSETIRNYMVTQFKIQKPEINGSATFSNYVSETKHSYLRSYDCALSKSSCLSSNSF